MAKMPEYITMVEADLDEQEIGEGPTEKEALLFFEEERLPCYALEAQKMLQVTVYKKLRTYKPVIDKLAWKVVK